MVNFNEVHKIENDIVIDAKAFVAWVEKHLHDKPEAKEQLNSIIEATAQVKKLNAEAAASGYVAAENPISTQPISGVEDTHSDASASVDTVGGAV